jgi:predicted metal-binding membrane protein
LFILAILRFASSKTSLSNDLFNLQGSPTMLSVLVVVYAVLLIMYFELSNGVIRYSMLDTSIRTNEVYVMNPKKIVSKYHRSLIINPVLATLLAWFVLSANTILPAIVGVFSGDTAERMRESVELTSVYGVALGTLFVFITVGILFGLNLPTHLQRFRERQAE